MAIISEGRFAQAVRKKLVQAQQRCAPVHNLHEGYSLITEEVDELWDIVRMRSENREPASIASSLAQIAAMCQRTAEDLGIANELPQLDQ